MPLTISLLLVLLSPPQSEPSAASSNLTFRRQQLSPDFFCEGATFADVDRDDHRDVIAGPYWYSGPLFQERHEIYEPKTFDPAGYSDNFFAFARDFDGDGWVDLLMVGFPGEAAHWFENPRGEERHWPRHLVWPNVDNEAPAFTDLTGDGLPELVFHSGGRFGWAEPDPADPRAPWRFRALSPDLGLQRFVHGLGVGDVDGDGRPDLLEKSGWWQQPASLDGDPPWTKHAFDFASGRQGGAQMHAYDVDGDGDADVVTSLAAHGFGLSWFEQVKDSAGAISFVEHRFMDEAPEDSPHGVRFAELHALELADMDGDGLRDIVTGKRWWSHGAQGDPEPGAPAVLHVFRLVRRAPGEVDFIPQRIDADSGVGVQVVAGDVDGDGRLDVVVGNKKGTFVFLQTPQRVPDAREGDPGAAAEPAQGSLPEDDAGRALNLDFETGDLRDWTPGGAAFAGQPVRGDLPGKRGASASGHQGEHWIGGYEVLGDRPTGTLTSAAFTVTEPWASFLLGGGAYTPARVELWQDGGRTPFFQASGANVETMQRVAVDLRSLVGQRIYVRLVDEATGGWGHLNFDDFRLHAAQPELTRTAGTPELLAYDAVPNAGLPAHEAARAMTLPEGFRVDVLAAEPELHQPIALAIDERGRIWVAEAFTYPRRKPEGEGEDTILVFEDRDADGAYETRTVFAEGLNLVSGLQVGFGGVWVGAAPELLFIPDRDGDLVPDGPPEVLLDGWGYQDTHETLNTFVWGPDGWLYGCHGVFTDSFVARPGTPAEERVFLDAAVWRFHPVRRTFEVFAEGTSNPWGIDFDEHGQAFITACVIPHLYHVIQGAHYERQSGDHPRRHVYDDIKTIADHRHYVGASSHVANLRSNSAGGGHAHCGALIYLADQFPERYRGSIFMSNIHGNRLNNDLLERKGSGFVGRHGPDFLLSNDQWSRAVALETGPEGSLYWIDWYDAQACHWTDPARWDRTNGRLYRVSYGQAEPLQVDLQAATDEELVALQRHSNEWFARHARRLLQERGSSPGVRARLAAMLRDDPDPRHRLRALWALHVSGALDDALALEALGSEHEYVQAWAIQLLCEEQAPQAGAIARFAELARESPSKVVRLYLASALQRLPEGERWRVAEPLARRAEDAQDPNLPLMLWYGIEPLVAQTPRLALEVARTTPIAALSRFIVRRAAAEANGREVLARALAAERDPQWRALVLEEMERGLADVRGVEVPPGWPEARAALAADPALRERALWVSIALDDRGVLDELRVIAADSAQGAKLRRRAIDALARAKDAAAVPLLQGLLGDAAVRAGALEALAGFADPGTAQAILARYATFDAGERQAALSSLASRAVWARELLAGVERGTVARADLGAFVLRSLSSLGDCEVDSMLRSIWGIVRESPADRAERIRTLKEELSDSALARADPRRGREVFDRACAQCHTLFDEGGTLGPELTGSNRADLDYLLSNVVDPSAVVGKDYLATMVWLEGGQLVTGVKKAETDSTITLQTETGTLILDRGEIEESRLSEVSAMPEGLLDTLRPDEIRDLVAYVRGAQQVALPDRPAPSIFDGRTLAGWSGDGVSWSVEDGEVVGRTQGLARNEFLKGSVELADFRLTLEVKLAGERGNSGIQFRSRVLADGEVEGYQADIGPGWWGKLYEEHGRGLLWERSGEDHVRRGEWNTYTIEAIGHRVRTWINGHPCVDLDDPTGAERGILALQIHSGGPTEVRFRNLRLELEAERRAAPGSSVQPRNDAR